MVSYIIDYRIAGIPCQVRVDSIEYDSIDNTYEIEYSILDRKGYSAAWLGKKVDLYIDNLICDEIVRQYNLESHW